MNITGLSAETLDLRIAQLTQTIESSFSRVMNVVADQFALDAVSAAGEEIVALEEALLIIPTTVSVDALAQIYAEWSVELSLIVLPAIQAILAESAENVADKLDEVTKSTVPRVSNAYAEDWLANANNRLNGIGTEVWEDTRDQLAEGMAQGESIPQLQERIRSVAAVSTGRAERIARTEVISASNAGSFQQARVSGVVTDKEWLATHDSRTRDSHRRANGQKVGLDEPFTVGGYSLMFPGDPNGPASEVVNCRCTPLYEVAPKSERSSVEPITAAGINDVSDVSTLGMIALVPTQDDIARIVIPNGEIPEELHTTLIFLGDITAMDESVRMQLVRRIQEVTLNQTSITASGFGAAIWNPATDHSCIVMNVGGECIEKVHHDIEHVIRDLWGLCLKEQHKPWVPHIAMAYSNDANMINDVVDRLGPITYSHIRVAFGESVTDIPLYDSMVVASAADGSKPMPYHIGKSAECGASEPHAVIKDDDGSVLGCHDTLESAQSQLAALHANEDMNDGAVGMATDAESKKKKSSERACDLILTIEGIETGDGRLFSSGSLVWSELPLPLQWQEKSAPDHSGSVVVGRIDNVWRDEVDPNIIHGAGVINTDIPYGQQVADLVDGKYLRGISIDADSVKASDIEFVFPEGPLDEEGTPMPSDLQALFGMEPELAIYHSARIRGATIVALPAYVEAQIRFVDTIDISPGSPSASGTPASGDDSVAENEEPEMLLAGGVMLSEVKASMFADPKFSGPTPWTVTADGRVFGHAALYGTCHIGVADKCIRPPYEASHDFFALGEVLTADGSAISVGGITIGTGHAPTSGITAQQAVEHYDNTGTRIADVAVGSDEFGIWVAGVIRPGVSEEQIAKLRAASLSGDWRRIGGALRLVALLAVNVPGFPVPRTRTSVDHGRQISLVASGIVTSNEETISSSRVRARLSRHMRARRLMALRSRMNGE